VKFSCLPGLITPWSIYLSWFSHLNNISAESRCRLLQSSLFLNASFCPIFVFGSPPGWGLGVRLTTSPCKKKILLRNLEGAKSPPRAVETMMMMIPLSSLFQQKILCSKIMKFTKCVYFKMVQILMTLYLQDVRLKPRNGDKELCGNVCQRNILNCWNLSWIVELMLTLSDHAEYIYPGPLTPPVRTEY
jgi:hypothetical protein